MSTRAVKRLHMFSQIKSTAIELIIDKGVSGFSMHKLAARLSLTPGALYRYYDSKDELMVDLQLEILDSFHPFLIEVAKRRSGTPIAAAIDVCFAYMELQVIAPQRFDLNTYFVSIPEPIFDDELASRVLAKMFEMLAILENEIVNAHKLELIPELGEHRGFILWSSLQSLIERRKFGRMEFASFDHRELAESLLLALFVGWGADHASVTAALKSRTPTDELSALYNQMDMEREKETDV